MAAHILELQVAEGGPDVPAGLDFRDGGAQLFVRRAAEVALAHPVRPVVHELRVEVEVRAAAVFEQLETRIAVLRREVDRRRERIVDDDAVVDELPDGQHPVDEPLVLRARVAEGRIEHRIERAGEVVERALRREAAEERARRLRAFPPPRGRLRAAERVARVVADGREEDRHHVEVPHPPEAERRHARHLARGPELPRALRADLELASAAPELAVRLLGLALVVLDQVLDVPVLGDAVGVAEVGVRHDQVAAVLRVLDAPAQLRLAAERRLDRERLRPAPVVPTDVPPHEAEFGPADTLALQLARDVAHAVERHGYPLDRGLVLGHLLRHRARHRLPRLADADLGRRNGVLEGVVALHALLERLHRAPFELVRPVRARHAAVVRRVARERAPLDREVLVGRTALLLVQHAALAVDAVARRHARREVVLQALHERDVGLRGRLHAEHGHRRPTAREVTLLAAECTVLPRGDDPVARIAHLRRREVRRHREALRALRPDRRARQRERRHAVLLRHLHALDLGLPVLQRPRQLDLHARRGDHRADGERARHKSLLRHTTVPPSWPSGRTSPSRSARRPSDGGNRRRAPQGSAQRASCGSSRRPGGSCARP